MEIMIQFKFATLPNFLLNLTSARQAHIHCIQSDFNNCYMMETMMLINFAVYPNLLLILAHVGFSPQQEKQAATATKIIVRTVI